jgi:MFS family permease
MNKAMGIWGDAAPVGGTVGVFLGGIITAWFDWSWVFLINVPIGIAVLALSPTLLPKGVRRKEVLITWVSSQSPYLQVY